MRIELSGNPIWLRQHPPIDESHLGGAMNGQPIPIGVPFGEQPARLHRHGAVALDREAFAPRVGRVVEGGIGSPRTPLSVSATLLPGALEQEHIGLRGHGAVDDGGQGGDIEHDGIERVLGRGLRCPARTTAIGSPT